MSDWQIIPAENLTAAFQVCAWAPGWVSLRPGPNMQHMHMGVPHSKGMSVHDGHLMHMLHAVGYW